MIFRCALLFFSISQSIHGYCARTKLPRKPYPKTLLADFSPREKTGIESTHLAEDGYFEEKIDKLTKPRDLVKSKSDCLNPKNQKLLITDWFIASTAGGTIGTRSTQRPNEGDARTNNKTIILVAVVATLTALLLGAAFATSISPMQAQQPLDFTVIGSNDCLRFLEPTVKTCYVPLKTGANEHWRLTIECLKMPGSGGWTDLYSYEGYWDGGVNNTCMSKDLYPILSLISPTNIKISTNCSFTQVYGGTNPESHTILFIFPPGGQATYHVTLKQVDQ